jgi:hypothetical protein
MVSYNETMSKFLYPLLCALLAVPAGADTGSELSGAFDGGLASELKLALDATPEISGTPITWVPQKPDERPGGGGDSNPGSPDEDEFWDRLQSRAFDQICKNIKIQPGGGVDLGDFADIAGKYRRRLRRYPNGEWALVERMEIGAGISWSDRLVNIGEQAGFQLQLGGRLEGVSHVVRPLGKTSSCRELGTLLKLWDAKFVLPLKPSRFTEMAVGELWKIPLTLEVRGGFGVGRWTDDLAISMSYSRGRSGRAAVSLYRMAEDKLRFRLRLDRAELRDKDFKVTYWLPAVETGLPTLETVIIKQAMQAIDKALAKEINHYLEIRLGLYDSKREGKQILLEYILDPNDPEQMQALDSVIDGDLDVLGMLTQMVGHTLRILNEDDAAREELARLTAEHSAALGTAEEFAGINEYDRNPKRFFIFLPFIWEHEWQWGNESDRYVLQDDKGGEFQVYRKHSGSENAFIDIPILGQINKHNERETVQTFTYTDKEGNTSDPVAVYLHQEGFLRASAPTARRMVGKADDIMRLVGTRGEGSNPDTALPADEVVPGDLGKRTRMRRRHKRTGKSESTSYDTYKRGVSAFTLVFGQQAINDIITTPRETIYAAYANTLSAESRRLLEAALAHAELEDDGELSLSTYRAVRSLGMRNQQQKKTKDARRKMRTLANTAARIVIDLERAAAITDPTVRAERFTELLAGDSKSDLGYNEIAKIFVQLTDPANISASMRIRIDKNVDDEEDINTNLVLNQAHADEELIAHASTTRSRFAETSDLRD